MGRRSNDIGKECEQEAVQWFLTNRPAKLIARNFRCKVGEIDFIVEECPKVGLPPELVFVEVKARASQRSWIAPIDTLDWKKIRCLQKAAAFYLQHYSGKAKSVRYDLLCWNWDQWEHRMNIQIGE